MNDTATTHERPDHSTSKRDEPTLGRLWNQYLKIRVQPGGSGARKPRDEAQRKTSRQAVRLKNRLVVNYSPLVKYVAGRVRAGTTGKGVSYEDMVSWGVLGLLDAIETYDPDRPGRKAKFESYAISKIRWAILDELRSQDWVPRRLRSRAREVERAMLELTQKLRRPPREVEIAAEAGMTIAEYCSFLEQYSRTHVASLETPPEANGGPGIELGALVGDPAAIDPQFRADLQDLHVQLTDAIRRLEERERFITTFYFYEGLTLKEIGKALSLTEGRVSQILRDTLAKLRDHLQEEGSGREEVATARHKDPASVRDSGEAAILPRDADEFRRAI